MQIFEKNIKIKQQFYSNYKNFELAGQIAPSFIKINASYSDIMIVRNKN